MGTENWLFHTPSIWKIKTVKRFRQIKRYFHLTEPVTTTQIDVPTDRLHKICRFLNEMKKRFQQEYLFCEHVTVDECMVPFKGRWHGRQYIKSKPVKWGIKVDILADWETGYNWDFRVYSGKVSVPDEFKYLGVLGYLVAQLMSPLKGPGHKVALDRGYSSPYLFYYLALKGIGAIGTVQTNRNGFPKEKLVVKACRTQRGEWDWFRSNDLLAARWCDSRPIYFLSNYYYPEESVIVRRDKHGQGMNVNCTSAVVDYNNYMNGVDRLDLGTVLDKRRKQYKWYMRLFLKVIE